LLWDPTSSKHLWDPFRAEEHLKCEFWKHCFLCTVSLSSGKSNP
jgi:hypothetical protein